MELPRCMEDSWGCLTLLPRAPKSSRWTKTARVYWQARFSRCLVTETEFLGPGYGEVLDAEATESLLGQQLDAFEEWLRQ